jgi:hypothetical protein
MDALHTHERAQEAINLNAMHVACQRWNDGDLAGYLQLYHQAAVQYGSLAIEEGIASIRQSYEGF